MTDLLDPPITDLPLGADLPTVDLRTDRDPTDDERRTDPEAPFGRKDDGTPYKRSPEWRAANAAMLAAGRARKAQTRRGRAPSSPPAGGARPQRGGIDYRPALSGIAQVPMFALGLASKVRPVAGLHAAALALHCPPLIDAINETAQHDDRMAAILDRIVSVGPYGAILAAALPLGLQFLANHGVIPPNKELGVLGPNELLDQVAAQARA